MFSHTDHTEHSVHVVMTEYGVADLRGKTPRERAALIIDDCAHPDYRPLLREHLKLVIDRCRWLPDRTGIVGTSQP